MTRCIAGDCVAGILPATRGRSRPRHGGAIPTCDCPGRFGGWACRLGPALGLASLLWFLVRVIPKPSRAAYPCQRVAFPLASGFVLWLVGLLGSLAAFRRARRHLAQARVLAAAACLGAGIGIVAVMNLPQTDLTAVETQNVASLQSLAPLQPIGVAQGIHPGRVVWIHEPNSTD
jgi:hypothetical protein